MRWILLVALALLTACGSRNQPADKAPVDLEVLTHGKVIDLDPHVRTGTITVFDFYADWCPPCVKLNRGLKDMKRIYGDRLTIYKLDLVAWDSELAVHYQIKDLPHLKVYGPDGQLAAEGPSVQVMPQLMELLNK